VLKDFGLFVGNDLNIANDNLLATLFFKRLSTLTYVNTQFKELFSLFMKASHSPDTLTENEFSMIHSLAASGRLQHSKSWLQQRVINLTQAYRVAESSLWGVKEPNLHIISDKFLSCIADLKFIYVCRNGLDMAFSKNMNQLNFWGSVFLDDHNIEICPRTMLKYWCVVFRRIQYFASIYHGRIFFLDFDKLCDKPAETIVNLASFLGIEQELSSDTISKIVRPKSVGRYLENDLSVLDPIDVRFVSKLYDI